MQTLPFHQLRHIRTGLAALVLCVLAGPSQAGAAVVTFDTFPNGDPAADDGVVGLTDAYTAGGISFTVGFDSDGDNVADAVGYLEAIGGGQGEDNGFLNDVLHSSIVGGHPDGRDRADDGFKAQLGSFLYRTPDLAHTPASAAFIIQFDAATRPGHVSGEIWDIDGVTSLGFERWLVTTFDASGNVVDSVESPLGVAPTAADSLDGRPWLWSTAPGTPIDRIEIVSTGTKTNRIGLAFDNITVSAGLPEPASCIVFIGLAGFGLLAHRPRRRRTT